MRKQFAKTIFEVGGLDKRLTVLIGDISHFLLRDIESNYPSRFFNMGMAEQAMMSVASGLAINGLIPVVHSIAPFVTERCFEQIKDDLCYQNLGVNIISVGSAFDYASLGCTHHCYDDIAILRTLPNMQIIYPSAPHEFDILFRESYANGKPKYFRLPAKTHNLSTKPKFGEVEKLHDGECVTLVAVGPQIQNAYDAAIELAREGISCDVLHLTTIKPISENSKKIIVESVSKTQRVVTVEESSILGGIADEIANIAYDVKFRHRRIGIQDKFMLNYGKYDEHCKANGLTKEGIIKIIHEFK
ncbi:MAG: transketolase C-terminal domain-containing protein [bacterium]|nr:transketolase C-terminal domain-containing protein [bacterium]